MQDLAQHPCCTPTQLVTRCYNILGVQAFNCTHKCNSSKIFSRQVCTCSTRCWYNDAACAGKPVPGNKFGPDKRSIMPQAADSLDLQSCYKHQHHPVDSFQRHVQLECTCRTMLAVPTQDKTETCILQCCAAADKFEVCYTSAAAPGATLKAMTAFP